MAILTQAMNPPSIGGEVQPWPFFQYSHGTGGFFVEKKCNPTFVQELIESARGKGAKALSEYDAKKALAHYGVPVVEEHLCASEADALKAAESLGYPIAAKACAADLAHKTEHGLVHLGLDNEEALLQAVRRIQKSHPGDGVLVQRMALGKRELIAGGIRDAVFGPCVMLGAGGIAVEATGDVAFRLAPLEERDALEMMSELGASGLLDAFRGEAPADKQALCEVLSAVGQLIIDCPGISQIDVNPLILEEGRPVAVDALITLADPAELGETVAEPAPPLDHDRFRAFMEPESLAIVGVSEAPGKWGYRILFNTLEGKYTGRLYGVNPKYQELMGVKCFPSITDLPEAVDLALIILPPAYVHDALRECAAKGVRTVLVITAGFGEVGGEEAEAAQHELEAIARETGMLVIGPNCAGIASPAPKSLYSGMIARFPGPGGLTVLSQSGNVGSTVLTWASLHQIGISRFISSGNEAATRMEDYLHFLASDERTDSIIAYIEGTRDGRRLYEGLRVAAKAKPLIVIKGGRSKFGMRAAQSHTGALASETTLFHAACRQAGAIVVEETYKAMEVANVFIKTPVPKGRRVVIVSQGGGWGVIGADACADAGLDLVPLPDDLFAELDAMLPPWWSRNNPIDLVAGNDINIVVKSLETVIKHPDVDAVILLGFGYIASAADRYGKSELAIKLGLDKLVEMGRLLEIQHAQRIAELISIYKKPILVGSDTVLLAYGANPNAAIAELERLGIYAFSSPGCVARALAYMAERHEFKSGIPRRLTAP